MKKTHVPDPRVAEETPEWLKAQIKRTPGYTIWQREEMGSCTVCGEEHMVWRSSPWPWRK